MQYPAANNVSNARLKTSHFTHLCFWIFYHFITAQTSPEASRSANLLIKPSNFSRARSSNDAVKCQRARGVRDTSLHICLTWDGNCQKSKKSSGQNPKKTRQASERGRWGPSRATASLCSAEPPAACTASAAAPWAHSARPASPSQPYSSSPSQSAKVSQPLTYLVLPYLFYPQLWRIKLSKSLCTCNGIYLSTVSLHSVLHIISL